jgi:hypothetical protein
MAKIVEILKNLTLKNVNNVDIILNKNSLKQLLLFN